jgi:ketosteroid isomerase-like protein
VRLLGADYVLSTARYVLTRGDSVTASGPFTVIWQRRPEGWRMVHDHTS